MKKQLLLLLVTCLLTSFIPINAQDFITTWKTDNPGNSDDLSITIPIGIGAFNYDVNWGDGTTSSGLTANASHTYAVAGTYTVAISGTFPHLSFPTEGNADNAKLLSVEQWGNQQWASMANTFYNCSNLVINATDAPNLSNVTDMSKMFKDARTFNQDLSAWDVSNVTDMSQMFSMFYPSPFNQDLSAWDVSNVTNMSNMFNGAVVFNQDLSTWDVGNVTDMHYMFWDASAFNQDLSTWNVSKVTDMSGMFGFTDAFNQNIGTWNVGMVTDMSNMFYFAAEFNQDLNAWNVSSVTNMYEMFKAAFKFNGNMSAWNVSNVTDMSFMFDNAWVFNQDISAWNVSNVSSMFQMFSFASAFNQNLGNWDISNVLSMSYMLYDVTLSLANYDTTLMGWNTLDAGETQIPTGIFFGAGNSVYCTGEAARTNLTNSHGWTITDGGLDCSNLSITDDEVLKVSLFPNPVKESFSIKGLNGAYQLQIVNLQGQIIKELTINNTEKVSISNLANGLYFVNIKANNVLKTIKIIKSN